MANGVPEQLMSYAVHIKRTVKVTHKPNQNQHEIRIRNFFRHEHMKPI